jgi:hypothetical protein
LLPQLLIPTDTASVRPSQTINPIPVAFHRRRVYANGRSKRGSSISPVAVPGRVSVNTTVIWYVPAGVEEEVMIVTAPFVIVLPQVAPTGRLRQVTEMLLAEEGTVTG